MIDDENDIIYNHAQKEVMPMETTGTEEQIKMLALHLGLSLSEFARRCGFTPQNFSQRLKRDAFTPADLKRIAEAAGCTYESCFICPDGFKVKF